MSTGFIAEHFEGGTPRIDPPTDRLELMAIACGLVYHNRLGLVRESLKPVASRVGAAPQPETWQEYVVRGEGSDFTVRLLGQMDSHHWDIFVNDRPYEVITPDFEFYRRRLKLVVNGRPEYFRLQYQDNYFMASFCGINRLFEVYSPREWELRRFMPKKTRASVDDVVLSPMPGLVVEIRVSPGDRVFRGQDVLVIESMKMESGVASPCEGEVEEIRVAQGEAVEAGDVLITFRV